MKKTYSVLVNDTGRATSGGVRLTVQAESEFEAMRLAIQRAGVRNGQVAEIKQK